MPKFIQIAVGGGDMLYALDSEGGVWYQTCSHWEAMSTPFRKVHPTASADHDRAGELCDHDDGVVDL